jgi:trehalose 6-phosphate phosphatase
MAYSDISTELPTPRPLDVAGAALFLDLDGTLAPLAPRPQDVGPDHRRTELLTSLLHALDGRLAVVSGRTLEDIDRILECRVTAVAAVHGLVRRRADGTVEATKAHPALRQASDAFFDFARRDIGLIVEDKQLSVTLHYRQAPDEGRAARDLARRIALETGLVLQHGDMVEELRTPGPTKGDSVAAFLRQAPFAGAHPIFLGDDATDEHGFAAVQALAGLGVLVGKPRATAARARLEGVPQVLDWLEAAL